MVTKVELEKEVAHLEHIIRDMQQKHYSEKRYLEQLVIAYEQILNDHQMFDEIQKTHNSIKSPY